MYMIIRIVKPLKLLQSAGPVPHFLISDDHTECQDQDGIDCKRFISKILFEGFTGVQWEWIGKI